jgi:hypothetical protein
MSSKFKVGDQVILGRHDVDPHSIYGFANWEPSMEKYVGKIATLKRTFAVHATHGYQWQIDIDGGVWSWHEKNMLSCLSNIITGFQVGDPGDGFQVGDPMVVKRVVPTGAACSRCREFNNYGEPNMPDGSYKCYSCRRN